MGMTGCKIDGCNNRHKARGLCSTHYKREMYVDSWDGTGGPCSHKGCKRRAYAKMLCSPHYRRMLNDPNRVVEPILRLPAGPVLDYLDRLGGLEGLNTGGKTTNAGTVTRLSEKEAAKWSMAIQRARKEGSLTVPAADRICIELFGLHPFFVYGEDWWHVGTEAPAGLREAA